MVESDHHVLFQDSLPGLVRHALQSILSHNPRYIPPWTHMDTHGHTWTRKTCQRHAKDAPGTTPELVDDMKMMWKLLWTI